MQANDNECGRAVCKTSYPVAVHDPDPSDEDPSEAIMNFRKWAAHNPLFGTLRRRLVNGHFRDVDKVLMHKTVAMAHATSEAFSNVSHLLRATPEFHQKATFSDVAVSHDNVEWYARLMGVFRVSPDEDRSQAKVFWRFYEVLGRDSTLRCTVLRLALTKTTAIEDIEVLRGQVHIVKNPNNPSQFFVNKFLFDC